MARAAIYRAGPARRLYAKDGRRIGVGGDGAGVANYMDVKNPILEANLRALLLGSGPAVAGAVLRARPRMDIEFVTADDGAVSAVLGGRQLASRRRPVEEAERLAATVPVETTGGVAVLGFGLGHHLRALAERMKTAGVVLAFEPDVDLLRAVLERVDHSAWLARGNVRLVLEAEDQGAIAAAVGGFEGVLSMGTRLLEHPPSKARLGEAAATFSASFTAVMKAVRTNVVTTLVQMEATIRNILMNLDYYATREGIEELRGSQRGRAAVVVSAGPSLRRNIELLARPGVRERVVIIAAQTVLKPLLAKGIRPHFVTALDYHEISRRFYEGLTAADVEGVTLVVEPKANPAILDAFPGRIRCVAEPVLDMLLGEGLARPMGELKPGATVAHLAYYLARQLGCDPVMLIGQDLGFTDGQYYSAGAAIHQVWSGELNEFRTLEMFEWERIVRSRHLLRKTNDTLGRPVYTDEQMATYLVQFERDFASDARAGLTVIDATEGGVAKAHTTVMTLAEALEKHGGAAPAAARADATDAKPRSSIKSKVTERVREVRGDVWRIGELSRRSARLLEKMLAAHGDRAGVNRLIGEVHGLRDEAVSLKTAYWLVHHLNQTGTLRRFRADRAIGLEDSLSPVEQQRRQISRDIENVRWLADSADQMARLLDDTIAAMEGGPKSFRDPAPMEAAGPSVEVRSVERRLAAVMIVDPDFGGLGLPRDLAVPVHGRLNALQLTLARLARCGRIDRVILATDRAERVRELVGPAVGGPGVEIHETDLGPWRERSRAVGASRLYGPGCWRGAIGNLTVYDEVMDAAVLSAVMGSAGLESAVVIGPDWALVDPGLIDAVIERHVERPAQHRLVFTQAAPGLAGVVIARSLAEELASARPGAGMLASVGGLTGYIPIAPQADPIAKPTCVMVPAAVRDVGARLIADSRARVTQISSLLRALGPAAREASAEAIARAFMTLPEAGPSHRHAMVELTTQRAGGSAAATWHEAPARAEDLAVEHFDRGLKRLRGDFEDAVLTLGGRGDPLLHGDWARAVRAAREAGFAAVHVRTELPRGPGDAEALLECGADVISVDLYAGQPATYLGITGRDGLDAAAAGVRALLAGRRGPGDPWIVPRITRCDAVYEEIEAFYNGWLMEAGTCIIDPLPRTMPGQRIEPLPWPVGAQRRRESETVVMRADGAIEGAGPAGEVELKSGWPVRAA
ncbi:MAG: DUF115 domain-containing protein [Phycisphaerales bacterium]|nr:DUF115 domain-containing protein [Phycisphaerales bacterium]